MGRDGEALLQQLSKRERELDAIWRVTQALATATDETSLSRMALHVALEVVGADAGAILLHDPASDQLVFRYVEGGGGARLEERVLPLTMGIASQVFASGRARISQDVTSEEAHARVIGDEVGYTTRDMITVPLSRRAGRPVGVMQVLNKQAGAFDDHDLHLLQALGSQVALAVEQARLYQEARLAEVARMLNKLDHEVKNYLQPVLSWAGFLERLAGELPGAPGDSGATTSTDAGRSHTPSAGTDLAGAVALRDWARRARAEILECASDLRGTTRRAQGRAKEMADCVQGASAPLKLAPCDVAKVAQEVLSTLRPVADQHGVVVALRPSEGLPSLQADEDRLFCMLYNLTENAITAVRRAERPGEVVIAAAADASGKAVTIEVSDTGCGMGQGDLCALFTTGVRSTTYLGTGLGTKIVKDAVDLHGGRIEVQSTLGVGTTFRVELPVLPEGPR